MAKEYTKKTRPNACRWGFPGLYDFSEPTKKKNTKSWQRKKKKTSAALWAMKMLKQSIGE